MKTLRPFCLTIAILAVMLNDGAKIFSAQNAEPAKGELSAALKEFAAIHPIDTHMHVYKDDPAFTALMKQLNLRMVNICVIDDRDPAYAGLEPQRSEVLQVAHSTGGHAAFCTTFSPYDFEDQGFSTRVNHQLDQDFANGAVAVKIYKVMGMEMKSKAGKYVMADDPAFEPIYQHIAAQHRTVIAHLAEPDSCWQAPNPASPDYDYYKGHPGEYAFAHPEWPSKASILAARDHLLALNPDLKVVGAHLGSMESDVNQMAQRFDRYPNFAVDTAARVPYFMLQSREKVRAFLIKYQDRILYATDIVISPEEKMESALQECKTTYERDWKFFATNQTVQYMGHTYRGLHLPEDVLCKIFHDNAVQWIPGILGAGR